MISPPRRSGHPGCGPGRGGRRLASPHRQHRTDPREPRWHEHAARRRPRMCRPRHPGLPRPLALSPLRAEPAPAAPVGREWPVTGRPSIPWSATASTTPPPTRPSSSAGGNAGRRPTSASPPGSSSTRSMWTVPPAWPPSASWHGRRTCRSPVRWWPRGAVAGTTGSPPPGSATAHPEASPTSTGAASAGACSPHPVAISPEAPTAGCATSTRRRCPRYRPPCAPCSTPTDQPRPVRSGRAGRPHSATRTAAGSWPPNSPPWPSHPGQRNHTLNQTAFKVYRYVAGGLLDDQEVTLAFTSTAVAIGLDRAEVRRTLASARTAGLASPRGVPCVPPSEAVP